jgi:acyl-lipid omega-6 desaturase (Delta-12 desaturase)
MRTGKELISASKEFTGEDRQRSWAELFLTILFALIVFGSLFIPQIPLPARFGLSFLCSLLYVRLFVIYHDYQHNAILQRSSLATAIMKTIGVYLLAPQTIWKRSHDYHHNNNSKLTISGIGSYPTISVNRYLKLKSRERAIYLLNRHPFTVIFGYFTLFIYWLNLKSFIQSPSKHLDSLLALVLHFAAGAAIIYYLGTTAFLVIWFVPFFLAFGIGSYLFYCQHNFPGATFRENPDWKYDQAALESTSYMVMNPVMQWFTGNIGYHHVHHLNSRIPFYRLPEVMEKMPELQGVSRTSWSFFEVIRCFRLKLWDPTNHKMITLSQMRKSLKKAANSATLVKEPVFSERFAPEQVRRKG